MAAAGQHVGLLACVFLSILLHFSYANIEPDDSLRKIEIDVKPGGVLHEHVQGFGDFKCTFTYTCQGGTNEKWDMILTESQDKEHYSCTVERPNGKSYLFFQTFDMQISGAKIVEVGAFADLATPLKGNEYTIDYAKGKVSHLKGFQSMLAKLDIFASTLSHGEL